MDERAALEDMSIPVEPDPPLTSSSAPSPSPTQSSQFDDDTIRGIHHPALLLPTMTTSQHMICVTSPSDDGFLTTKTQPCLHSPRRRRSSHLERWIQEQQSQPSTPTNKTLDAASSGVGTPCNPYLAYPHMNTIIAPIPAHQEEDASIHSYDLLDDDDIPEAEAASQMTYSATPPTSPRGRQASLTPSTPNSHLSVRPPSPPISGSSERNLSPKSYHRSLPPTTPSTHARPTSLSASRISVLGNTHRPLDPNSDVKSEYSAWRWPPSVHGHFASHSIPHVHVSNTLTPTRHSVSSMISRTTTSVTPTMSCDGDPVPDNMSFVSSLRSRAKFPFKPESRPGSTAQSPSHSAWSLSIREESASMSTPALPRKPSALRLPFAPRPKTRHVATQSEPAAPYIAYSSNTSRPSLPLMSFSASARNKRKRKLVVTGIGENETDRFNALKRWCESFGEVSQITRMADGELHVHFKKATVADTVCRVRAQVCIPDVGSVFLSWYTGNKP